MFLVILLRTLCQRVANLMSEGGQILTLSYLGGRESNASLQRYGDCKIGFRDKC